MRRFGAGPGPWNSARQEMLRGKVAVKKGAWVDVARGTCGVSADFARDLSLGIQLNKKCPGGMVVVKIGAWVDVMRGKCGVGADFARDLALGIQLNKKCSGARWLSKSVPRSRLGGASAG